MTFQDVKIKCQKSSPYLAGPHRFVFCLHLLPSLLKSFLLLTNLSGCHPLSRYVIFGASVLFFLSPNGHIPATLSSLTYCQKPDIYRETLAMWEAKIGFFFMIILKMYFHVIFILCICLCLFYAFPW